MVLLSRMRGRMIAIDPAKGRCTGSEPVRTRCRTGVSANANRNLEHHPVREHAERFVAWLQDNNLAGCLIFHDAILELYAEMVIELGWAERSWNPVARQLDLICTGGRKPYEWILTPTGRKRRLRVYPIPPVTPEVQAPGPNVLRLQRVQ